MGKSTALYLNVQCVSQLNGLKVRTGSAANFDMETNGTNVFN